MLRLIYLYRNLTRNPLRTLLTCAAVALPIIIYVMSMAVVDAIDRFLDNSAKQLRLAVTHKASVINPLPAGYRAKIESLDPTRSRLLSVCGMRFIGGKIEGDPYPLSTLTSDMDTFVTTFPEPELTPDEIGQWNRDRQAIIVGKATALHFQWSVGDRITIRPSVPPYFPLEFRIVAISRSTTDAVTNFCRRDYYDAWLIDYGEVEDIVSFFFVKCATQADLEHFRAAIDAMFANAPDETKTQDEKTFMNEFISQQFNLPRNLTILAWVTIFVAVMAAANTMSMNFRDRLGEFASLRAIGLGGRMILGLIQSESLLTCAVGGAVGALTPYIAFNHTPLREFPVPLILHLPVEAAICAEAMLISLVIGVAAALWPSWMAVKLKVIVALRSLE